MSFADGTPWSSRCKKMCLCTLRGTPWIWAAAERNGSCLAECQFFVSPSNKSDIGVIDTRPTGLCCKGWQSSMLFHRADPATRLLAIERYLYFTNIVFQSGFAPRDCVTECTCLGTGLGFGTGPQNFESEIPDGRLWTCQEEWANHRQFFGGLTYSEKERVNYSKTHTWYPYAETVNSTEPNGLVRERQLCDRVGACCTDQVQSTGTPDERQCRLMTRDGCIFGIYENSEQKFRSNGVFMGNRTDCICKNQTNDPFQTGEDTIYNKCVGISDFLVGARAAHEECGRLGSCCFEDCCAQTTEKLCSNRGGSYFRNRSCRSSCPDANCREAVFNLAFEDGVKPDDDFRELIDVGYMIAQSDVTITMGSKTRLDTEFGAEFEFVDPYPDIEIQLPICGYWTGKIVLNDDNYVVLQACNGHRYKSTESIEANAILDENGYAHFGVGYNNPEHNCHGLG